MCIDPADPRVTLLFCAGYASTPVRSDAAEADVRAALADIVLLA